MPSAAPLSAPHTATRYRVLLLGPFRVERGGDPIDVSARQPRVRTLFKLLVTAPDRQRLRDERIDILWPNAIPDTAPGNLRRLVHRLRRALGGNPSPVLSDHGWIALNPAFDWELDLDRLHTRCIVMELLEGRSLGDVIRQQGTDPQLSLASIKKLAQQVAGALASAHERGIVHRDVKPDNIIVGPDDHATVTDFGVARLVQPRGEVSTLTSTGMTMGTSLYMAPEQIEGKKVDARADIYALGAVIYELVTGRPSMGGRDPLSIAFQHVHQQLEPPSWQKAEVSEDWDALILRALAKNPADRF